MNKVRADPKVKKTLVRNCEQKLKPNTRKFDYDVGPPEGVTSEHTEKEIKLNEPTLCSSKVLDTYLTDLKRSEPPQFSADDLNADKGQNLAKITKKLNFHLNDKIYKNLIELNASCNDLKTRKDKKLSSAVPVKRDVEPNIEDFYEEVKEKDTPPAIPVTKPKFKPVRKFENGQLHRLVSTFENL